MTSYKDPRSMGQMPIVTKEEADRTPNPNHARIVVPDKDEYDKIMKLINDPRRCGLCEHFRLRQGQMALKEQQTIPMAIHEYDHNIQWYGDLSKYGLCAKWEGHLVHCIAPARIPNQFLDSSIPYNERDRAVECPSFTPRRRGVAKGGVI
jgi:hypothetical protein